jgi:hypothetical protein
MAESPVHMLIDINSADLITIVFFFGQLPTYNNICQPILFSMSLQALFATIMSSRLLGPSHRPIWQNFHLLKLEKMSHWNYMPCVQSLHPPLYLIRLSAVRM